MLIVEDDLALREVYGEVLRDEGWEVHLASNGIEALDLLADGVEPCVALVDLRMPRMDGWSFLKELRSGPWHDLPFVVVAAHYRIEDEAQRVGARWWLQKPVDIGRMVQVVSDACASRQAA